MGIKTRKILLFFGDLILLYFSLFLSLFFRYFRNFNSEIFSNHLLPFSILYFLWLIILYIFGGYDLLPFKSQFLFRIFSAFSLNFLISISFFYFFPIFGITPKTNLVLNLIIFAILFLTWRFSFYSLFSTYFLNKVAILGSGNEVENLKKEISQNPSFGFKIISIDPKKPLAEQIKKEGIDIIIFTEEFEEDPKFLTALYLCLPMGVNFLDFATAFEEIAEKIPVSMVSKNWFLKNLREGEKKIYDKFKRIFDLTLALIILSLTFPFWPLISLAIKIEDGGPVFYKQERIGKNKKIFKLVKFRSMIPEAEKGEPKWAEIEDQRITKVGKFLRRFHLDEIPQMINVIRGDISLVGPRPERPEFVEKLEKEIPHYNLRHIIKPGFTGWAQIKFRYARSIMDSLEKFQYDLYYIKNRSLFLDLKILLKTFQLFFKKE
jgi:exopolysaccharide biosynthesis polyprenyl glycosylphosphotransferase